MNSNYDIAEAAPFSYAEYRNILQSLSEQFDIIDYGDIDEKTESFCVIRHDIEFSVRDIHRESSNGWLLVENQIRDNWLQKAIGVARGYSE